MTDTQKSNIYLNRRNFAIKAFMPKTGK